MQHGIEGSRTRFYSTEAAFVRLLVPGFLRQPPEPRQDCKLGCKDVCVCLFVPLRTMPVPFLFPCRAFFSPKKKAVETAIHSMRGLQGRDQRLQEWKSKAYSLSNAEARALSARLLGGKQVCLCIFIRDLLILLTRAAGAN